MGGQCLSEAYLNANIKLTWKCSKGHIFNNSPLIKERQWCRICGTNAPPEIEVFHWWDTDIARSRNGRCLSDAYQPGRNSNGMWACHLWNAEVHSVKSGTWCPVCGHLRSGRQTTDYWWDEHLAETHGTMSFNTVSECRFEINVAVRKRTYMETLRPLLKRALCAVCAENSKLTWSMLRQSQGAWRQCLSLQYK